MSIPAVQKATQIKESSRRLFSEGEKPFAEEIAKDTSNFFGKHSLGKPLSYGNFILKAGVTSDPKIINMLALSTVINLSILYQSAILQSKKVDILKNTLMMANKKLARRRNELEDIIDGYLLGSYNADGYFYSVVEKFNSVANSDLKLTSAFLDILSHSATIPSIASGSRKIDADELESAEIIAFESLKSPSPNAEGSPNSSNGIAQRKPLGISSGYDFKNCLDTRDDTCYHASVFSSEEKSVTMQIDLSFKSSALPVVISRVEAELYGVTPAQMMIETFSNNDSIFKDFGSGVISGTERLVFIDAPRNITTLRIFLRKDKADIVKDIGSGKKYEYIFGFKNLFITKSMYDNSATLVSQPFSLPQQDYGDAYIDAVSLEVDSITPEGTALEYFVASDDGSQNWIDDFAWKRIDPINGPQTNSNLVKFDGISNAVKMIRSNPLDDDLQLIPIDTTATSYIARNPSPSIVQDTNVYRIAAFDEDFVPGTIKLEEGIDTTRIYYVNRSDLAKQNGLSFWQDRLSQPTTKVTYGNINNGSGFFYGGDIGENGKSVYLETYLESDSAQKNIIKDFKKLDSNSLLWDVRVFLNGSEVAHLETGIESKTVPWMFKKGLNHIALCIDIPSSGASNSTPYLGSLDIMAGDKIGSYGTTKLANWSYVDIFKLRYNEVGTPYTFSIFNNEIVSRRKPTNNLRLKYAKPTGFSPSGIRFRCNFIRSSNAQAVTPVLNSYRLRFSYGENNNG